MLEFFLLAFIVAVIVVPGTKHILRVGFTEEKSYGYLIGLFLAFVVLFAGKGLSWPNFAYAAGIAFLICILLLLLAQLVKLFFNERKKKADSEIS
jgi:hypothetical protein